MIEEIAAIEALDVSDKVVLVRLAEGADPTQDWMETALDGLSDALRDAGAALVLVLDHDTDLSTVTLTEFAEVIGPNVSFTLTPKDDDDTPLGHPV